MNVARIEGGKIIVPTRFQAENLGFLRSLPGARFDKKRSSWIVVATPRAACRLIERGYSADFSVCSLADEWLKGLADPAHLSSIDPPLAKTRAREAQRRAFWFAYQRQAAMLAVRMGKGKSKVAIDLLTNWRCRSVLILCPKSVIGVWPRELAKHGPDNYVAVPLDSGSSAGKVAKADAALAANPGRLVAVIVNYETAIQPAFRHWALAQDWSAVVCDESHRIKQASGKASKFAFEVGQNAERRLALTGTPMPHDPLDLFGQLRFLDAGIFGTSWVAFRQRYALCSEQFRSQVLEWLNQEELQAAFHSIAYVDNSIDDLDLPPVSHETVAVELSAEARRAYRELEEELIVDLGAVGLADFIGDVISGEVTTGNPLTKLLRLQQIASGHVKTDDDRLVEIDRAKAEALADLLDSLPADEPVCVFCQYRHNLQQIERVAETLGRKYGEISGSRKDLGPGATFPPGVQVLGVQWQSGATGIDLTAARYGVIYSPTFNGGNFLQGLARQHRPGQTRPTFFYHLLATGTVDHAVFAALQKRSAITEAITNAA
jgi:SNF2 family DNA or RNA helicase